MLCRITLHFIVTCIVFTNIIKITAKRFFSVIWFFLFEPLKLLSKNSIRIALKPLYRALQSFLKIVLEFLQNSCWYPTEYFFILYSKINCLKLMSYRAFLYFVPEVIVPKWQWDCFNTHLITCRLFLYLKTKAYVSKIILGLL